ncbi:hypothetical protein U1Q18_051264 [Sarracenia purpurea var. burkii]
MLYASVGLPVMFMYLSSMGSLLSTCARHVFSRTLCCCLCSKCGYCCYDEKLMEEKERRMKRKRQQREYQQQIAAAMASHHSQPFYVKSPSLNSLELASVSEADKQQRPGPGHKRGQLRNVQHRLESAQRVFAFFSPAHGLFYIYIRVRTIGFVYVTKIRYRLDVGG